MPTSSLEIVISAKDEASKIFKEVGGQAGGLGSKLEKLIPLVAGLAAGFASFKTLEGAISQTQELGSAVGKLSRETGLTAEAASKLLFAFKHVGLDAADASRSLGIFEKNLKLTADAEAKEGEKLAHEYLKAQGAKGTAADNYAHVSTDANRRVQEAEIRARDQISAAQKQISDAYAKTAKDHKSHATEIGVAQDKIRLANMALADTQRKANEQIGAAADHMNKAGAAGADAEPKLKNFAEVLDELHIQARDATGEIRPMEQLIPELADAFKAMPNGVEKTADSMILFGKSGKDMLPLLNLGAQGLEEMGNEAQKLGLVLSGQNVADIKAYTLAQRDMDEAIAGVKLQIGLALMPVLTDLSHWFVEQQPIIREYVSNGIDFVRGALIELSDWFAEHRDTISDWANRFIDVATWLVSNLSTQVGAAIETFNALKDGVETAIDLVDDLIHGRWQDAWADLKQIVVNVGTAMLNDILMIFGQIPNLIIDAMNKAIDAVNSVKIPDHIGASIFGIGGSVPIPGGGGSAGIPNLPNIPTSGFNITDVKSSFERLAKTGKGVADVNTTVAKTAAALPPVFKQAASGAGALHGAATDAARGLDTLKGTTSKIAQVLHEADLAAAARNKAAGIYDMYQRAEETAGIKSLHDFSGALTSALPSIAQLTSGITGWAAIPGPWNGYQAYTGLDTGGSGSLVGPPKLTANFGGFGSGGSGGGGGFLGGGDDDGDDGGGGGGGGAKTGVFGQFYGRARVGPDPRPIHVHVEINQREIGRAIVDLQGSGGLRGVFS